MAGSRTFILTGGGTGGHVMPAVAVAAELQKRGHRPVFVGTATGMEARLVPTAGFPIEWIEIGALNRVGRSQQLRTLAQIPRSVRQVMHLFGRHGPAAIFSTGGYVAGPVMLAAVLQRLPLVVMEPNAVPGLANRWVARLAARGLVNFEDTRRFFPAGKAEVSGVPVREAFFQTRLKQTMAAPFTVLITGGSRGSRTLNQAAQASWPLFAASNHRIRMVLQTGVEAHAAVAEAFRSSNIAGQVVQFIEDMPAAFAEADLVVCRSGASTVSELAAAGKPSVLVPFPFAADDHQLRNAEAVMRSGGALLVPDREMNGERLFAEVSALMADPDRLREMAVRATILARPGAAQRAADVLESLAMR